MKIISLSPLPDYKLDIKFEDGVSGEIELRGFIEKGIFSVLKNEDSFNRVYSNGYSVAWSDELEIDALVVYAKLLNKWPDVNMFFEVEKYPNITLNL